MTVASSMTKAKRLEKEHQLEDAAKIYGEIISKYPQNTKARDALESLRQRTRNIDEPPAELVDQIKHDIEQNNLPRAAATCASHLNTYRKSHYLWQALGLCHLRRDNLNEAATCLNKAMELNAQEAETFVLMANVYAKQGNTGNAIALFRKALSIEPTHIVALNDLGNLLLATGDSIEALKCLETASQVVPDNARVLYNFASALRGTGQLRKSKEMYEAAIQKDPSLQSAHFNLGQLYTLEGNHEEALPRFENALSASPNCDRTLTSKLHAMAHLAKWEWLDEYAQHRRYLGLQGKACSPFHLLAMEDNPDLLRVRTQAYAGERMIARQAATRTAPAERPKRLKIGYFSSDFYSHATMHLMGGLFEAHNRDKFEIYAYSFGPMKADTAREQVQEHVDHFIEAAEMSDVALVQRALDDELDIAIDLKGFTGGNRCAIFANQLAPIQISYLGFPGTMGSSTIDYMIADWQVCPAGSERYYDEHLIRMPHSYQINDRNRAISETTPTRAECGLPDDAFVFCCFNNSYKITPAEYDIWMRLLVEVPNSVLWLLDTGPTTKCNLLKEAEARGVDTNRLIFAPRMDLDAHLARHRLADLFLDTFIVNAHTTASDALWAGLPVLTVAGKQFAARVSASLLSAIHMPELIATTPSEYEAMALKIATEAGLASDLKQKLGDNRLTTPLFDTESFVRDLEAAFDLAYSRWQQGLLPDHLDMRETSYSSEVQGVMAV